MLAGRIVAYRDLHGSFTAVEDLLDVGGIGEAKLAAMRDSIAGSVGAVSFSGRLVGAGRCRR